MKYEIQGFPFILHVHCIGYIHLDNNTHDIVHVYQPTDHNNNYDYNGSKSVLQY